jgi:hypothetical protein
VRALARLVSGPAVVQTVTPALEDPHRAVRACAKAVIAAAVASRSEDAPSRVVKEARSRR